MRPKRTIDEKRILERLGSELSKYDIKNPTIDGDLIDRPDVLIDHAAGRMGLEISRLDYEDYCRWLSVPPELPYSRSAEITINLNRLLATCMEKKKDKYEEYKKLRNLDECWLILFNNVFDFHNSAPRPGDPDRAWFERYSHWELQELSCPFDKVLFNLEHPNEWYLLFDKSIIKQRTHGISKWPSIIYQEAMVQTTRGLNRINLAESISRDEFK